MRWHTLWPILILLGAAPFTIFNYTIHRDWIDVKRLLWSTSIPLAGLQSAEVLPNGMKRSLRLFGNYGLYSITGWYWNRTLGLYRAFVTDSGRTVVLHFDKRKIILSPENPQQFVADLNKHV